MKNLTFKMATLGLGKKSDKAFILQKCKTIVTNEVVYVKIICVPNPACLKTSFFRVILQKQVLITKRQIAFLCLSSFKFKIIL